MVEQAEYKTFKEKFSLQERQTELQKQIEKYPNMVPVIVEWHKKSKSLKPLVKTKFLVSQDVKLCEFLQTVRKKLDIGPHEALFFFIGKNQLKSPNKQMKEIYYESKDKDDGFLYIVYCDYDPFGNQ